jgi:hypothetical protein
MSEQILTQCPKCEAHLDPHWSYCPQCAAANPRAVHDPVVPTKHEKYPLRHAAGGLFFGLLFTAPCLIAGGMLCCTILGVFAGVPLIILGILAPLIGVVLGLNELEGKCPWCGTRITSIFSHTGDFACPACSRMVVIHNHDLQKAA